MDSPTGRPPRRRAMLAPGALKPLELAGASAPPAGLARAAQFEALELLPLLLTVVSVQAEVVFSNRAWREFTGSELLASECAPWTQWLHPDDAAHVQNRNEHHH